MLANYINYIKLYMNRYSTWKKNSVLYYILQKMILKSKYVLNIKIVTN